MSADQQDSTPVGLFEIHSGRIHRDPDGAAEVTTTVRAKEGKRPPGTGLISTASWLLLVLGAGVLAVSYAGQFAYIFAARHQVIASNIEAGMFDVGMMIFAVLGLGLAFAGKPARAERVLVVVCALGSAAMGYAAADVASPRSVAAFVAPPLFLAIVVDRVIAVVRRHRLGDAESSPWAPLGRAAWWAVRAAGLVLLYLLRLILDPEETAKGLRRVVLIAAPLPTAVPAAEVLPPEREVTPGSKKAALLVLYRDHPAYGDRASVSPTATELAPQAGLQPGTARSYILAELTRIEAAP